MKKVIPLPSQEHLRGLLSYDPPSGELRWLPRPAARPEWNTRYAGQIAGKVVKGQRFVRLDGRHWKASRLIWKMMIGSDPTGEVDHQNVNTLDNQWNNLRDATRQQNGRNRRAYGKQFPKGVSLNCNGKRYCASIHVDYQKIHIGVFDTITEAARAYDAAARRIFGEFARPNFADQLIGRRSA